MNRDGVTDAFYDTVLHVTWLRDTKLNGATTASNAAAWASNLTFGGYDDWRLPTMIDTGSPNCDYTFFGGTDCGFNVQTTSADGMTVYSEMASLWYDTLGNLAFCAPGDTNCTPGDPRPGSGLTNTGLFLSLEANGYWTGLTVGGNSDGVWYFGTGTGIQGTIAGGASLFSIAVRDGDVPFAVVEPGSLYLIGIGALGLVAVRRRQ